jgi:hypothetical protein
VKLPERIACFALVPFDRREGLTLNAAAAESGKSPGTVRNWCIEHGIGRKVGGGNWVVSKVALAMYLDGDDVALSAYLSGDRESDFVITYFSRFNLRPKSCLASQSS